MKRILLAGGFALAVGGQALAADLPPAPMPPPRAPATYVPTMAPVYNWAGIYFGANAGYGFGTSNWSGPAGSTGNFSTDGFLGGGTLGFNYMWGPVVLGVEGDGDWTNLKGSASGTGCAALGATGCQTSATWLATVRGRAGYAIDRVLLYATGGGAFGNITATGSTGAASTTTSSTNFGWTAGAGVEFAFAPNWTIKGEYLYVSLQNGSFSIPTLPVATTGSVKFQENVVRGGVNFKFAL
jgi:outer membrane immunogenic protein